MINIIDKASEYSNSWDYSFLIVAIIAIIIGSVITMTKVFKSKKKIAQEQKAILHNEKVLDDPESLLKKK